LETFTTLKGFVNNPNYNTQRQSHLDKLDFSVIDSPIIEIIRKFAALPYCFTLQCCYGHFLYTGQKDSHNLEPLPAPGSITEVEYRIAYIALCIEDSTKGNELFEKLKEIPSIDPDYIQFGCAEWFWERQVNSYALQVEPKRFMIQDSAIVDYREALHIEKIRGELFVGIIKLL
jgi:hypothetical protein